MLPSLLAVRPDTHPHPAHLAFREVA
jgi:hypothetical protein